MKGIGRMVEPAELYGQLRYALTRSGPLKARKIVVTAGGTHEPLDPVRGITNRSSGKQGFALAQAALDRAAEVLLITGPTHLPTPIGAERVEVNTAEQMKAAVLEALPGTTALIMAAAVADFRPVSPPKQKIKKDEGLPQFSLEATPDILAAVAEVKSAQKYPQLTVGFAAESQNLIKNARNKLNAKKLDLIIANDILSSDAGFAVDSNRVTILDAGGGEEALPLLTKDEVAQFVLERVIGLLGSPGVEPS
jgi:phosphopantothenoylcysteine decarboxylase/phosphopantothenate--cysteine ligase